jgi:hypothetical protein
VQLVQCFFVDLVHCMQVVPFAPSPTHYHRCAMMVVVTISPFVSTLLNDIYHFHTHLHACVPLWPCLLGCHRQHNVAECSLHI